MSSTSVNGTSIKGTNKVLFFVDRLRVGGIQRLLVDLLNEFALLEQPCELLLLDDGERYELEDELRSSGVIMHKLEGIWVRRPADYLHYQRAVRQFFHEHHDYCAVHVNSGPKNYPILKYAARWDIPVRIAHAHNTGFQTSSKAERMLGNVLKYPMCRYANCHLACSENAGAWLFGKQWVKNGKVIVLSNGIRPRNFAFDAEMRQRVRAAWGVGEDVLVVGHVGRFTTQKNHKFLLKVFAEVHRRVPASVLVLVGTGELEDAMRHKVDEMGLSKAVRFLGFHTDVANLMQGMDVFLIPSLYEGFMIAGIEAQAAGLPCVFSDTITRESRILDAVAYLPLAASPARWAETAISLAGSAKREGAWRMLADKGFDVSTMAKCLVEVYRADDSGGRGAPAGPIESAERIDQTD